MARPSETDPGSPGDPAITTPPGGSTTGPSVPDSIASLIALDDWKVFILGYGALWLTLTAMVDAGPPAKLAAAIALSIAGGATVIYLPHILAAHGLTSSAPAQ